MSEWISLHNLHFAWLALDRNDNEPLTFLEYLFAACQVPWEGAIHVEAAAPAAAMPTPLQAAIVTLANTIAAFTHQIILILDNYHEITHVLIHRMIALLLDNLSAQFHLVIAGRTAPPLSLARLRARAQMEILRTDDLRFTLVETSALFRQNNANELRDTQIAKLHTHTEGWVEGLHIAALALSEQDAEQRQRFLAEFGGSNRYVADYLFEEAFAPQSTELQAFLLQTSLLDRLNGLLCSFVTGQARGQDHLEFLEEGNLFIVPLDEQRNWYRYHQLFKEFLHHRLHQTYPDQILALHSRASKWYEHNGMYSEAIQHAIASQEWDHAMHLIDRVADAKLMRARYSVITKQTQKLPSTADVVQAVALDDAALDAVPLDFDDVADDQTASWLFPSHRLAEQTQSNALALGRAHLRLGHAHKAEHFLSAVNLAAPQFQDAPAQFALVNTLSACRLSQGRLHLALATCEPLLALAAKQSWQPYLFDFFGNLCHIYYEWNQLPMVRQYLTRGLAEAEHNETAPSWSVDAHLALMWLAWAEGNQTAAEAAMQEAERVAHMLGVAPLVRKVMAHGARLDLRRERYKSAVGWAKDCGLDAHNATDYGSQFEYLTLARVMLAQKQPARALSLLDQLQALALAAGRAKDVIEILLISALAHQANNAPQEAFAALAQAVCEAEQEGYVRTFVDEGAPLYALLQQVAASGITRLYVQRLLDAFPRSAAETIKSPTAPLAQAEPANSLVDPLSERELEVLRLVATGHANREIAQSLQIATSTVKKHVGNILSKLGVRNRTRAAAKARELRLL
ncbi:MAG: hypothetical protein H6641_23515 [Caldilineaceae bacterium]|nr:hypothetical protein [Caldilineaceae bacterium]